MADDPQLQANILNLVLQQQTGNNEIEYEKQFKKLQREIKKSMKIGRHTFVAEDGDVLPSYFDGNVTMPALNQSNRLRRESTFLSRRQTLKEFKKIIFEEAPVPVTT